MKPQQEECYFTSLSLRKFVICMKSPEWRGRRFSSLILIIRDSSCLWTTKPFAASIATAVRACRSSEDMLASIEICAPLAF